MGRFVSFFGWPILTAIGLVLLSRRNRMKAEGGSDCPSWTRAWATATLVLGLFASVIWRRIILPEG